MAHTASIKELEERKKALVAKNDRLRESMAERFNDVTASSFWILRGIEMAQSFLGKRGLFSTVMGFLKNRVGGE